MEKISKYYSRHIEPHLNRGAPTLNPPTRRWRCSQSYPCKRVKSCPDCRERRRDYFVTMGERFIRRHKLDTFLTLSWPAKGADNPWSILIKNGSQTAKLLSKQSCKYIRVNALGDRDTPHLHILGERNNIEALVKKIQKVKWQIQPVTQSKEVWDVEGVLGYVYDHNYIPTFQRTDRPQRIKLLSGSRGLYYGYPNKKQWQEYKKTLKSKKDL